MSDDFDSVGGQFHYLLHFFLFNTQTVFITPMSGLLDFAKSVSAVC